MRMDMKRRLRIEESRRKVEGEKVREEAKG